MIGVIGVVVLGCLLLLALALFIPRRPRRVQGREDRSEKPGQTGVPPGPVGSKEDDRSGENRGQR
jgi:hypothetical protein